jgi:tetratricopeptide (TPR) repeat protein
VSGVDEVTRKLRGKMGESLRSVQASPPLEQVTTSSFDALKAYTEGARAFDLEHDFTKAIPLLRRAVAIDSGFATAWRKLGTALANSGHPQSAVDSAVTKAYALRGRLSENERYLAEGYYYGRGAGHDRQRAMSAYQALIARGDSIYAANNLGVFYSGERDQVKAESLYRLAFRVGPDNVIALPNLVNTLINTGNRAATDTFLALEGKRVPNSGVHAQHLAAVAYRDGNYDRAGEVLDSIHAVGKASGAQAYVSYLLSAHNAMRGRIGEAERVYAEHMIRKQRLGNSNPAVLDSSVYALSDAWFRKQPARAATRLDAALALHPMTGLAEQDRPYTDLAHVYAIAEQPGRARALLAQFAAIKDTAYYRSRAPSVHVALGDIAMAEKRYADAIAEYRRGDAQTDGLPDGEDAIAVHFNLGRAYDLANKPDSAIAELEAYVNTQYYSRIDDDAYALAGVHKRLGELYEAKGNTENAVRHFATFVELWKNADPELQPAVAEAKRRVARLRASRKTT